MRTRPRKQTVGKFASAALPALWKGLARKGWTHADLAREVGISTAQVARIMYGERGAGRTTAVRIHTLFAEVRLLLWDKPCPPNWRPNNSARSARGGARSRTRRSTPAPAPAPELPRTGTDD